MLQALEVTRRCAITKKNALAPPENHPMPDVKALEATVPTLPPTALAEFRE